MNPSFKDGGDDEIQGSHFKDKDIKGIVAAKPKESTPLSALENMVGPMTRLRKKKMDEGLIQLIHKVQDQTQNNEEILAKPSPKIQPKNLVLAEVLG